MNDLFIVCPGCSHTANALYLRSQVVVTARMVKKGDRVVIDAGGPWMVSYISDGEPGYLTFGLKRMRNGRRDSAVADFKPLDLVDVKTS